MKRKPKEVEKLSDILTCDRAVQINSLDNLFLYDLNNLLKEYFVLNEEPKISTTSKKNELYISVTISINSIKQYFNINR